MYKFLFFSLLFVACNNKELQQNKTNIILDSKIEFNSNFFDTKYKLKSANNINFSQIIESKNDSLWLTAFLKNENLIRPIDKKTKLILEKIYIHSANDSLILATLQFDTKTTQQFLFNQKGDLIKNSNTTENLIFLIAPDSSHNIICIQKNVENQQNYNFYKYDNSLLINMLDNFSANLPSLENTNFALLDSNKDGFKDLVFSNKQNNYIFLYQKSKDMFIFESNLK